MVYLNRDKFIDKDSIAIDKNKYFDAIDNHFFMLDNYINEDELKVNDDDISSVILCIVTCLDYFVNKDFWIEKLYILVKRIEIIFEQRLLNSVGFFNGYCDIEYSLWLLNKKTGLFSNFYNYINSKYISFVLLYLDFVDKNKNNLKPTDYDLVYGVSGIGYSLLRKDYLTREEAIVISKIVDYLNYLSSDYIYNGEIIPRFHVKSENQFRNDEKESFPNGNLNYGLSHGMVGPLIFLSRAYSLGYVKDLEKIKYICDIYERNKVRDGNFFRWSTQQSFEEYLNKDNNDKYRSNRGSWCYGYLGIASGFIKVSEYLNDKAMYDEYFFGILNMIKQKKVEDFYLSNIILCHGISYLLLFFSKFKEKSDDLTRMSINEKIPEIVDYIISFYNSDFSFGFKGIDIAIINDNYVRVENEGLSLLEGSCGIVLALLSIYLDVEDLYFHMIL